MTPRERLIVRGGAALVIGAALLGRGIPALRARTDAWYGLTRSRIELAARALAEIRSAEELTRVAVKVRERFDSIAPHLLPAQGPVEGGATLIALVEQRAGQNRTRVLEARSLVDSMIRGRVGRVTVFARFESDLPGVMGTLRAIESGAPAVTVRSLRIHSTAEAGAEAPEVLQADAVVSAWILHPHSGPQ